MEKTTFLCDVGTTGSKLCGTATSGYHIMIPAGLDGLTSKRFDLCEYHAKVLYDVLRGRLDLPRSAAEAACP